MKKEKIMFGLKKKSPVLLTICGSIGVVATTVLAVKATPKAMRLIDIAAREKGSNLTKAEYIKTAWTVYIPAALTAGATIACIFGANALNCQRQETLASAYIALDRAYKGYRAKVKEICGKDADIQIKNSVAREHLSDNPERTSDEQALFFDEYSQRYFWKTMNEVIEAEYHLNRNFQLRGYANLNEFYDFLGIERTDLGEIAGWSIGAGEEFYGYSWIDFEHEIERSDNPNDPPLFYYIVMPFGPTLDYMDY